MTEVHLINVHQPTQHLCAPPLCSSLRMSPLISRASTLCLKLWLDNAHTPAHASTRLRGPRSPPRLRRSSHRDPMPLLSTPSWMKMACSRCVSRTSDWANPLSKRTLSTRTRTPWIPACTHTPEQVTPKRETDEGFSCRHPLPCWYFSGTSL